MIGNWKFDNGIVIKKSFLICVSLGKTRFTYLRSPSCIPAGKAQFTYLREQCIWYFFIPGLQIYRVLKLHLLLSAFLRTLHSIGCLFPPAAEDSTPVLRKICLRFMILQKVLISDSRENKNMDQISNSPKEVNKEILQVTTASSSITPSVTISPTLALSAPGINSAIHLLATVSLTLFTSRNLYHWRPFIERTLQPGKLEGRLTNPQPNADDAHYLKWIDEKDVLFTWLLDSMKPEISD